MNAFNDFPDLSVLSELHCPEFDDHTETVSRDNYFTQTWRQEPWEVDFEQIHAQINLELFGVVSPIHSPTSPAAFFKSPELPSPVSSAIEVNNAASYPGSHDSIARLVEASTTRSDAQISAAVTRPLAVKNPSTLQTPSFSWPSEAPEIGNVPNFGSSSAPQDGQWFNAANFSWNGFEGTTFQYPFDQSWDNLGDFDFFHPEVADPFPHSLQIQNPPAQNPQEQFHTSDAAAFSSYRVSDGGIPPCDDSFPLFNNFDFASQYQQQHVPVTVNHHPGPKIFGWPGPDVDLPPESIPGLSTSARFALTSKGTKRKRSPSSCDETDQARSSSSSASSHDNTTCLWLIPDPLGSRVTCGGKLSEKGLSTHLNTHLNSTRHGDEYDVSKGWNGDNYDDIAEEHHEEHHDYGISKIKCKWVGCQEEYQASEIYRHVRKHLGWLKVQCGKCGKVLARKDSLKRHEAQCRGKKKV